MSIAYKQKSILWIGLTGMLFIVAAWLDSGFEIKDALILFGLCFACELIDSGLGMGYGTILTPTLLLIGYQPGDIVPTVLLSELLSGFTASFFHNEIRNVDFGLQGKDFKPAAILSGGSVVGVTAGVLLAVNLPENVLKMAIGCIILLSGLFVLLLVQRVVEYKNWKMLLLSGVASFNKAVSGGGYGPLVTSGQILSGVQGKSAVGITSLAEACTSLVAVTLFLTQGGYINMMVFIPMCAGALISVPFSVFAISKSNDNHLKVVIGSLTTIMGVLIIYKALS